MSGWNITHQQRVGLQNVRAQALIQAMTETRSHRKMLRSLEYEIANLPAKNKEKSDLLRAARVRYKADFHYQFYKAIRRAVVFKK